MAQTFLHFFNLFFSISSCVTVFLQYDFSLLPGRPLIPLSTVSLVRKQVNVNIDKIKKKGRPSRDGSIPTLSPCCLCLNRSLDPVLQKSSNYRRIV